MANDWACSGESTILLQVLATQKGRLENLAGSCYIATTTTAVQPSAFQLQAAVTTGAKELGDLRHEERKRWEGMEQGFNALCDCEQRNQRPAVLPKLTFYKV